MLKKDGIIDKDEMLAVQPQEYLSEGFLNPDGQVKEGINGEYSLAMAYRLKEEGGTADELMKLTERLYDLAGDEGELEPDSKLSQKAIAAFQALPRSPEVSKSKALSELFEASNSFITDWKNLAAFIVHIERIQAQVSLVTELSQLQMD